MQTGGEALERYAAGRASRAVAELEARRPALAHRLRGATAEEVAGRAGPSRRPAAGPTRRDGPLRRRGGARAFARGRSPASPGSRSRSRPSPASALMSGSLNLEGPLTVESAAPGAARASTPGSWSWCGSAQESKSPLQRHGRPLRRRGSPRSRWRSARGVPGCLPRRGAGARRAGGGDALPAHSRRAGGDDRRDQPRRAAQRDHPPWRGAGATGAGHGGGARQDRHPDHRPAGGLARPPLCALHGGRQSWRSRPRWSWVRPSAGAVGGPGRGGSRADAAQRHRHHGESGPGGHRARSEGTRSRSGPSRSCISRHPAPGPAWPDGEASGLRAWLAVDGRAAGSSSSRTGCGPRRAGWWQALGAAGPGTGSCW